MASMMAFSTACAQKVNFKNSSVVPAAKGSVKVKQDNNKNYVIEVKIEDLAEVERLQSSKQTYVVGKCTISHKTTEFHYGTVTNEDGLSRYTAPHVSNITACNAYIAVATDSIK